MLTGNTDLVNGSGGVNTVFGVHVVSGSTGDVTIVSNANMGAGGGSLMDRGISVGDAGGGVNGNVSVTLTGGTINYANSQGVLPMTYARGERPRIYHFAAGRLVGIEALTLPNSRPGRAARAGG